MKRLTIILLAAILFVTAAAMPAMAYEPAQHIKSNEVTENHRGRRHHRRGHRGGSDWVGFGIGVGLGILGEVLDDDGPEYQYYQPSGPVYYYPQTQPTLVYDPSCNCYYYR